MLEIIGAGASGKATKDWALVWNESQQAKGIQTEIDRIHDERASAARNTPEENQVGEYAMPFTSQLWYVTHRSFQGFWREPSYVWAKIMLATMSSLFIGFTFFKPDSSLQGFQDVIFSAFMLTSIFSTLVQQYVEPQIISVRRLTKIFLLESCPNSLSSDHSTKFAKGLQKHILGPPFSLPMSLLRSHIRFSLV
jgi:hypothetical protein